MMMLKKPLTKLEPKLIPPTHQKLSHNQQRRKEMPSQSHLVILRTPEMLLLETLLLDKKLLLTTITPSKKSLRNTMPRMLKTPKIRQELPPKLHLTKTLLKLLLDKRKLQETIPRMNNGLLPQPLLKNQSRPQSSKLLSSTLKNPTKTRWTK